MVKHVWSALCQKSVVDATTNNISLIDIFERLEISPPKNVLKDKVAKVLVPVNFELVNLWSRANKKDEAVISTRVTFNGPSRKEMRHFEKELIIPLGKTRMREIIKIQGLPVKESGIYTFVVSVKQSGQDNFTSVAEIPLEVVVS